MNSVKRNILIIDVAGDFDTIAQIDGESLHYRGLLVGTVVYVHTHIL